MNTYGHHMVSILHKCSVMALQYVNIASGTVAGCGGNCCRKIVWKFLSKNAKKTFRKNLGQIEIMSIHNLLCRKIATSCTAYFFNPRRSWTLQYFGYYYYWAQI